MEKIIKGLPTEQASQNFADQLAEKLTAPLVMTFSGEIGAGKTTLIRAMLRSLGITSAIKSPTFSLVESYSCRAMDIHHFDLYRIHDVSELEFIGFRDYFSPNAICCIEWPERLVNYFEQIDLAFSLSLKGTGRALEGRALSAAGAAILLSVAGN